MSLLNICDNCKTALAKDWDLPEGSYSLTVHGLGPPAQDNETGDREDLSLDFCGPACMIEYVEVQLAKKGGKG